MILKTAVTTRSGGGDPPPHPHPQGTDSRVADVDPGAHLVEVFGGPAVEAGVVRQQVVELLQRHLEARHVRSLRAHLLALFGLHSPRGPIRAVNGGGAEGGDQCGGQVSLYPSAGREGGAGLLAVGVAADEQLGGK